MKKKISLYIHIPFCIKKCNYCDFLSFGGCSEQEQKVYLTQLFREISFYREIAKEYEVESVFVGGGTPSMLQEGLMEQLFHQLYSVWKLTEGAEITVECNPGTLTARKLAEYRTCGVNRLSIGLQSADNEELKLLGRIHNYDQFIANYKLAREVGFRNINVDIMAALPGQTQNSFGKTLAKVVDLQPEHISVYSLIVEEGTPFAENSELLATLPSETVERRMYKYTKTILNSMGYDRYEISNYAKPGFACRHNQVYWTGGEYLGFGLGAASYWNGMRFENTKNMHEYLDAWNRSGEFENGSSKNENGEAENEKSETGNGEAENEKSEIEIMEIRRNVIVDTLNSRMEEFMFLGLRMMQGVSKNEFEKRFGITMEEVYGTVIQSYVEQGFLCWDRECLKLTEAGIDVSNAIMADFLLDY